MKKYLSLLTLSTLCFSLFSAYAQMDAGGGSAMNDAMSKIFGTNLNFSATMDTTVKMSPQNQTLGMPGKIYVSNGDSRTEMDMTKATGSAIPPQAIAQMKAMGMGQMVSISLAATKTTYIIYPGLKAFVKMQAPAASPTNDLKLDKVELGKETLDGHDCVKNQYNIVSPVDGQHITVVTWNAADLKGIPIQVQLNVPGKDGNANDTTMHFSDISQSRPAASLFMPPAGYTAYTDIQTMMQTEMMKKMGDGAGGLPPAAQ
jgi:hypothetical protein